MMMMRMTMMVMLMLPGAGRKNLFKIQNGKRKIVSIFITLGAKCAVIHKGSKQQEEGRRGRQGAGIGGVTGSTFTSMRCSTNMQTGHGQASLPRPLLYAVLFVTCPARACLCMSVCLFGQHVGNLKHLRIARPG